MLHHGLSIAAPYNLYDFRQFQEQKCDFFPDCLDNSDEKECPPIYEFDDCSVLTGEDNCGFVEDPKDSLDWIIGSGYLKLHQTGKLQLKLFRGNNWSECEPRWQISLDPKTRGNVR